jgi:DNA-directed RNA polymerase subunit alpha
MSVRTRNCLHNAAIVSIKQLLSCTAADLLRIDNFGRKSLREVEYMLAVHGLRLQPCEYELRTD